MKKRPSTILSASSTAPTRRNFLKALGLLSASVMAPQIVRAETLGLGGGVAANSRIAMGFIGVGGKGSRNLGDYVKAKAFPMVQVVSVCDVKEKARQVGQRIAKLPDGQVYTDFREMLSKNQLDAATISTPDHWHVPAALACIRKGMAVYVEKPFSLFVSEGRELSDVARSLNAKVQVGSQQRSVYPAILKAVRTVQEGRIGTIKNVYICLPKGAQQTPYDVVEAPSSINYDLWLGPAPVKPYSERRVSGSFRSILDYSNGMLADWGAHHFDIVQMALGMDYSGPGEIEGTATFAKEGLFDAPIDYSLHYYYPERGVNLYASSSFEPITKLTGITARANCIVFEGTNGWVYCERAKALASSPSILESGPDLEGQMDRDAHKANFIAAITDDVPTRANAEIGHRSATVCEIGLITLLLGTHLKWNPKIERFEGENSELANRYLWRTRRGNWYV